MTWDDYRRIYRDYSTATNQIQIVTIVASESLKEFPQNLPDALRKPLLGSMLEFATLLTQVVDSAKDGRKGRRSLKPLSGDPTKATLLYSVLQLYVGQISVGASEESNSSQPDFERLLSSQALIMVFAFVEAFIGDTLRLICSLRPEILKTEKKIEWATALEFDNKEDLITHLRERYVYDFGWFSLDERVKHLRAKLGLEVGTPASDLELLSLWENVRHVVIHNGGRVSQEFRTRTHQVDLPIGEPIPITFKDIERISTAASLLAADVFESVSSKFFGKTRAEITGLILRSRAKRLPKYPLIEWRGATKSRKKQRKSSAGHSKK